MLRSAHFLFASPTLLWESESRALARVLARYSAGVYQYYLTDAVGSVVALTDQNGVVQTQYSYGPFGATASTGAADSA